MTSLKSDLAQEVQEAYLKLGMTLRKAGEHAEAEKVLRHLLKRKPDARAAAAANLAMGLSLLEAGKFPGAANHFNKALQAASPEDKETQAAAWFGLGSAQSSQRHYSKAIIAFAKASRLGYSHSAGLWLILGKFQAVLSHHESAIRSFDRALSLDAKNTEAYRGKVKSLFDLEKDEEALATLKSALEHGLIAAWIFFGRAAAYQNMGLFEESLADYNQAIELDPNDEIILACRGMISCFLDRFEEGIADLNKAIELNPGSSEILGLRGFAYHLMDEHAMALADADRAIKLDSRNASAISLKGRILLLSGQYQEALVEYAAAIEIDPKKSNYFYGRALCYRALNKEPQARADLTATINLAQQRYENNLKIWANTLILALYHLAAGHFEKTRALYSEALSAGVPQFLIKEAIRALNNFQVIFPDHRQAGEMRDMLQGHLDREKTG